MKIKIYASMLDEVNKKLISVAKKAKKYDCKFEYSVSSEYIYQYYQKSYDTINHVVVKDIFPSYATVVDIEVSDDCIKQNGWSVVAKWKIQQDNKPSPKRI